MCCNKRRQARLNACGAYSRGSCGATSHAGSNLAAVISALQQARLNSGPPQHGQQLSSTTQVPRDINAQTQGVVYPSALDEKHGVQVNDTVDYEELPSYQASTEKSDQSKPFPTTPVVHPVETQDRVFDSTIDQQPSHPVVLLGLQHFDTGLDAYRRGDNKGAKRAVKIFVKELYTQEMERRRSAKGYLECGERKQIKRELRPLKEMLKETVREAKTERRRNLGHL